MTLVRVLKPTGFEQVGAEVDWRGPVDELIANGTLELINPVVEATQEAVQEAVAEEKKVEPEVQQEVQQVVTTVAPEVQKEIADIEANIQQEEVALSSLKTQVTK